MQSEQTNEISAALCKAQGQMEGAKFDKANPHFKNRYASLASVIEATRKPLADNGLAVTQTQEIRDGGMVCVTTLRHSSGQWIGSEYPLPMGVRPQELGSALTYARRYCWSAICGVASYEDDDDATGAHNNGQINSKPAKRANPHVTQPADIVPAVEYDEHGDPVNNIPRGDPGIERMSKANARPDFAQAQHELRQTKTPNELLKWGLANANRVDSFPSDWQEIMRGLYTEHMNELAGSTGNA